MNENTCFVNTPVVCLDETPCPVSPIALNVVGSLFDYSSRQKVDFVNLTSIVEQRVADSGIHDGFAVVQSLHSTTGLFVNEWQEALLEDFRTLLEQAVPSHVPWRHNDPRYSDCDRGNAASHLRSALLGSSVVLAVRDGRLVRGTWQSLIFVELDGPRNRSVSLQIVGG